MTAPKRHLLPVLLVLAAASAPPSPVGATDVSGNVAGTWTLAQSPYLVTGDLQIVAGDTLVIEPGVQVRFTGHYELVDRGTLLAVGTESQPIVFTRHYPTDASRWAGLSIELSGTRAMLRHCVIEYVDNRTQPQPDYYGALYIVGSCFADIRSCTIRYNRAQYGAGITTFASPVAMLDRLLVYGNEATVQGGGYYTNSSHPVTLANCVFYGNTAPQGGGLWLQNSNWTGIRNTIVWSCGAAPLAHAGRAPHVEYCDVQGGYAGAGNLDADPRFVNPGAGNFRLGADSPCRDAGDPAWVFNDPDATRNDMGAHGGPLGATEIPRPRVRFVNQGNAFQLARAGVQAWADFNDDGWDDLSSGGRVYRNEGGNGFTDVTDAAFGGSVPEGVWGDYDDDGLLDYYGVGYDCTLWRNLGNETFQDVTAPAGVRPDTLVGGERFRSDTATWVDIDNDGDLDLWVLGSGNFDVLVWPDFLYRNNGDGTFTDISEESGIRDNYDYDAHGRNVAVSDYDHDGDTDVYVGNYWVYPNYHYRNNADGTFTDIGPITRTCGVPDWAGDWRPYYGHTIGCFWADLNLDGWEDLLVSNLAHPSELWNSDPTLFYINPATATGEEPWADWRAMGGIRFEETHSAVVAADFDNDRDADVYLTSVYAGRRSYFYEQTSPLSFTENTAGAGCLMSDGWGASYTDWDNDGRLDLSARGGAEPYLLMYHNETPDAGRWIKVHLRGVQSNSFGVGARVMAFVNGTPLMREIRTAHGTNTSEHGLWAHFGVGDATVVPILRIWWPSGLVEEYNQLAASGNYLFVEGGGGEPGAVSDETLARAGLHGLTAGPNPAWGASGAPAATIRFGLSEPARVRVELFDVAGRAAGTLVDGVLAAGEHAVPLPPGLPAGVYLYRVRTAAGTQAGRCVVLR
jgi:hypothetical protein